MSQIDAEQDVSAILSQKTRSIWSPETGYSNLIVIENVENSLQPPIEPLEKGSVAQQQLATAALHLWFDHLPTAHAVFQNDDSANGSLWHAILHRREGDFSNGKYWLARAGRHPVYETIARLAPSVIPPDADRLFLTLLRGGWDPSAFVDLVRQVSTSNDPASRSTAVEMQRLEWRALFCHCARHAH